MPWESNSKVDIASKYPTLSYKDDYLKIQDFLTAEKDVDAVLSVFDKEIFADCKKVDAFQARLSELEKNYRFDHQVVTINSILKPVDFIEYVYAKRPLNDIGAGMDHGFATHRVQWMMVAYHATTTKTIATPIIELYTNLACKNAYVRQSEKFDPSTGTGWAFLWDDLFDRFGLKSPFVKNATSPEYLHSSHLPGKFPRLCKIWP